MAEHAHPTPSLAQGKTLLRLCFLTRELSLLSKVHREATGHSALSPHPWVCLGVSSQGLRGGEDGQQVRGGPKHGVFQVLRGEQPLHTYLLHPFPGGLTP